MLVKIVKRTFSGAEYCPEQKVLKLGGEGSTGVETLEFELPEEWAGMAVTVHVQQLDGTLPPAARDTLHFARDTAGTLLRKAAEHVREAKRIHDELEALCRPYVDFAAADALTERTLRELFPA